MTLYKNFGSKEGLIVATLKREDRMFRQWLVSAVEAQSDHSQDRILGLFDALHDGFASEGYYGCAFIRASVEYPAPGHPVHRAAREHKEMDSFVSPGSCCRSTFCRTKIGQLVHERKLVTPGGGRPDKLCGEHS